jgi:hypothetical protein
MVLKTPGGAIIDPANAAGLGVSYSAINRTRHYRFTLPVALAGGNHSGTWTAILRVDRKDQQTYLSGFKGEPRSNASFLAHGARYAVVVNTYSNLKMRATLTQDSYEPGAELTLRSVVTEYGIPVEHRASVHAEVTRPDATRFTLPLVEVEPGVLEASLRAALPGIYHCRIVASGATLRGAPFTRELTLDGATYRGGDRPSTPTRPDDQLPSTGETGGLGDTPAGSDKIVQILSRCCRYNTRILSAIALLMLIIIVLLWRR